MVASLLVIDMRFLTLAHFLKSANTEMSTTPSAVPQSEHIHMERVHGEHTG